MTAPTPTARGTPAGIPLQNSFPCKITLGTLTTVSFWEKEVQAPGYDGGDAIDTVTMFNTRYKTKARRALIEVTPMKGKAAYDPNVLEQIKTQINVAQTITKSWADGSTVAFYGYLKSFVPATETGDGTQPEADFEIVATNWDPVAKTEEAPVITYVSGT